MRLTKTHRLRTAPAACRNFRLQRPANLRLMRVRTLAHLSRRTTDLDDGQSRLTRLSRQRRERFEPLRRPDRGRYQHRPTSWRKNWRASGKTGELPENLASLRQGSATLRNPAATVRTNSVTVRNLAPTVRHVKDCVRREPASLRWKPVSLRCQTLSVRRQSSSFRAFLPLIRGAPASQRILSRP
jgi:hypothetical protein